LERRLATPGRIVGPRRIVEARRARVTARLARLERADEPPPHRPIRDPDAQLIFVAARLELCDAALARRLPAALRDQRSLEVGLAVRRLDLVLRCERTVSLQVAIAAIARPIGGRRAARDEEDRQRSHQRCVTTLTDAFRVAGRRAMR